MGEKWKCEHCRDVYEANEMCQKLACSGRGFRQEWRDMTGTEAPAPYDLLDQLAEYAAAKDEAPADEGKSLWCGDIDPEMPLHVKSVDEGLESLNYPSRRVLKNKIAELESRLAAYREFSEYVSATTTDCRIRAALAKLDAAEGKVG